MMCHANAAEVGNDWRSVSVDAAAARQAQSQDAQLRYKLGYDLALASPDAYRAADRETMVTFYAVHGLSKPWRLFGLSYRKIGANLYNHGGITNY